MTPEKFFHSKTAIITLFAACFVVLIYLGVRQVFGLFFIDFNESLNISNTAFGLADVHEKELGYIDLTELEEFKGKLGLGIERDRYSKIDKTLEELM